ncbi:Retrovirus-related Pol polyprotein from transposon 17.6, partial [Mucuna pruriens]
MGMNGKLLSKLNLDYMNGLVMPFGLTNSPNTFLRLMNHVLRSLIGKYVVVYFNDILVYSNCVDDHILNVKSVLILLRQECLACYVVGYEGVKAIQNWLTPKTIGEIRSFHGLASFYRRFVKDFSTLGFKWEESQERVFQALKERLTNAPILTLPNFSKTFELECDASNIGVGAILLKEGHLIAYFDGKLKMLK